MENINNILSTIASAIVNNSPIEADSKEESMFPDVVKVEDFTRRHFPFVRVTMENGQVFLIKGEEGARES